ncbi:MAG: flagellar export chaperone FlgN [Phycisphaerales bacterium]
MAASNTAHHDQPLAARIDDLIEDARSLLDQLSIIADEQRAAIAAGEVPRIVEIVAQREPLIRQLVRVGEEIGAVIEAPETADQLTKAQREDALARISGIEHTMKRLREQDAHDQELMENTRDRLASQLAGMGTGRSALKAYSTRSQTPDPIMQDRRG